MTSRYSAVALGFLLASAPALGGSIRYDLPGLLGEHRFDDPLMFIGRGAEVATTVAPKQITAVRFVVSGSVSSGRARGDGVQFDPVAFELLPAVNIYTNIGFSIGFREEVTPDKFFLEWTIADPFADLLSPPIGGYPVFDLQAFVSIAPSLQTIFPHRLSAADDQLAPGYVIEQPIIAHIDTAYIILSGPTIVPEPSGWTCAGLLSIAMVFARRRLLSPER